MDYRFGGARLYDQNRDRFHVQLRCHQATAGICVLAHSHRRQKRRDPERAKTRDRQQGFQICRRCRCRQTAHRAGRGERGQFVQMSGWSKKRGLRHRQMPQRYLDDFTIGEVFKSSPHTLTEKHFAAFAEMTGDVHPLHYNLDYARTHGWDAPLAHGLLLFGLCALGAAPISRELTDSMVAMLGNEARYKCPAFIGDTVTPQFTVVGIEPKGNERGILRLAIALHNQSDELVLEGAHILMLKRRT